MKHKTFKRLAFVVIYVGQTIILFYRLYLTSTIDIGVRISSKGEIAFWPIFYMFITSLIFNWLEKKFYKY